MQSRSLTGYDRILADLDEQLPYVERDFRHFAGCHLFITGGTGFVGTWLLESIAHANARLQVGIRATILTRSADQFRQRYPRLGNNAAFEFVHGDIRNLPPSISAVDGIIHAATPASAELNKNAPFEMLDTIIDGGRAVIDFAARFGKIPLLFTSSGAVYGPLPSDMSAFTEAYTGAPNPLSPNVAYHEGKRVGEFQCAVVHQNSGVLAKIARLFAFVGPYLPMDRHLAVGNFIADAYNGRTIHIAGDGTTVRSYQYAAEMTSWLWAIFARGEPLRAYNVGSEEVVTMRELAELTASSVTVKVDVRIQGVPQPGQSIDRYVPSTLKIRNELGVVATISLHESLQRTLAFLE